jgi:hypothetical protein
MVLVSGGGYAEYVVAHTGCVMRIPEGISMIEAGGKSFHLLVSHKKRLLRYSGSISHSIPRFAIDCQHEKR